MARNWHPQGSFSKHEDRWVVGVESGQGRTPVTGDHATVHKRDGSLDRVTLGDCIGQRALGTFGHVVYLFEFVKGWNSHANEMEDSNA